MFDWDAAAPSIAGWRHAPPSGREQLALRLPCINAAERPVILAGHGVIDLRGDGSRCAILAEQGEHPGRRDAARHRRPPRLSSPQPRHDGHARRGLGQHRHPGSRPAHRLRHAVRRSRHGQPEDLRAPREEDPHRHRRRPKSTRTSGSTSASSATSRDVLDRLLPAIAPERSRGVAGRESPAVKRRRRGPRHPAAARRRPSLRGARHQRSLARRPAGRDASSSPTSASTRCGKRSTTTTRRRARSSRRAAWARWDSRCRPRSAPSAPVRRRRSGRSSGDGGFQMTMCELATAVQEGLAIKVAIINNGFLGMVRQWQEFFYERRYAATPLSGPDFVKLAESFGIRGRRSSTRAGVLPAIARCARPRGPGGHRLPRRAGRHRLPDGAGRRRSARDDPPAESDRRNRTTRCRDR